MVEQIVGLVSCVVMAAFAGYFIGYQRGRGHGWDAMDAIRVREKKRILEAVDEFVLNNELLDAKIMASA